MIVKLIIIFNKSSKFEWSFALDILSIVNQQLKMVNMKRIILLYLAIFCMVLQSFATVHTVLVGDFSFSPNSFAAHPGDTILWKWSNGKHTTTSTTIPINASSWNGNITYNSTSFMYVPTVKGTYNYECTVNPAMRMIGSFAVTNNTGLSQVSSAPIIRVYPNPVSISLHIQFNTTGLPVSILLMDANGDVVLKKKYKVFVDADIDLQNIPNGNYILYAKQGNSAYNEQLIVAH